MVCIEEYKVADNDQGMTFHTPRVGRILFIPLVLLLGWLLYFWATACGVPQGFRGWCTFIFVALPFFLVFLFFLSGALPHELHLDFRRSIYELNVGYSPLNWQRSGSFNNIRSTYVQRIPAIQPEHHIYQIGVVWQGRQTRPRYSLQALLYTLRTSLSDNRYRFACSQDVQAAEALARRVAARLNVPYDGLLLTRGSA